MIPKEVIEKAAEDWVELRRQKHSRPVPRAFVELWIPMEATPERAFEAGAKWALEEIGKVEK